MQTKFEAMRLKASGCFGSTILHQALALSTHRAYISLYISLPSSAKQRCKLDKFCVLFGMWMTRANFPYFYLELNANVNFPFSPLLFTSARIFKITSRLLPRLEKREESWRTEHINYPLQMRGLSHYRAGSKANCQTYIAFSEGNLINRLIASTKVTTA